MVSERLWVYPIAPVIIYVAFSLDVLWIGHPHEDAYIF